MDDNQSSPFNSSNYSILTSNNCDVLCVCVWCIQCTLYTVQCTVYTLYCIVCSVYLCCNTKNIVNTMPCSMTINNIIIYIHIYIIHSTMYYVHYTSHSVICTLYIAQCAMYIIRCTVYYVHYTLYSVLCTLTLYSVQCKDIFFKLTSFCFTFYGDKLYFAVTMYTIMLYTII